MMRDSIADLASFSQSDVASILERELPLILRRCQSQDFPHAILLAGQPGAGKTELSTMMVTLLNGNAAFINADDYRRYHPNYRKLFAQYGSDSVRMTAAFSAAVVEHLIDQLSSHRLNLVVEGTGRTVEVPKATAEALTAKGYTVEMAVIAARPEVSLASTLIRFCRMNDGGTIPRATALAAHDAVVDALPGNLDQLSVLPCIERVRIWDRELRQLYDSRTGSQSPSECLTGYWHSPWSRVELDAVSVQLNDLQRDGRLQSLEQGYVLEELSRRLAIAAQSVE